MIHEICYDSDGSTTDNDVLNEYNLINSNFHSNNITSNESNDLNKFNGFWYDESSFEYEDPFEQIKKSEIKIKWGENTIKEITRLPVTAYRLIPYVPNKFIDDCIEYNHKITLILNTVIYPYMIFGEGYEIPGINILDNTKSWDEDDTAIKFYSFFQREGIVNFISKIDQHDQHDNHDNQHDNEHNILANKKTYPIFDRFSDQIRDELIYYEDINKFENINVCFDEIYCIQIFKFCKIIEDNSEDIK
jgi:hypothetical protein